MNSETLPPGPTAAPAVQMLNWIFRPIRFLEDNRKRYGDHFSVTFPGFQSPMVMISKPEHVAAVYRERRNGLPPGRTLTIEPILGPRSILLLEGSEHLARRKLMLPPFHGERMRAYEEQITEIVEREIDSWPIGGEFKLHPRMQAVTLEAILNAVFGVSDDARRRELRPLLGRLLDETSGPALQIRFLLSRRIPWMKDPLAELRRSLTRVDDLLAAEAAERRADPDLEERTRHPLDAGRGPLRGRRADERRRAARSAADPARRRPRDDGDGARLGLRPAAPQSESRWRGCARRCWPANRTSTCGRRSPRSCACGRSCRSPGAGSPSRSPSTASSFPPAPT